MNQIKVIINQYEQVIFLVATTLNMKVMEINTKLYLLTISKIKPYLNDLIDHHKTQGEWKPQLTMKINFISSKDSHETRAMYTKSNNIEIILGKETDEIIDELFNSFLQRYQKHLQESMRGSFFFFLCWSIVLQTL